MHVTKEHRTMVEREILEVIIAALESKRIDVDDLPKIAKFVLDTVHLVETHQELESHLGTLIKQWPILSHPKIHKKKLESMQLAHK